MLRCLSKVIPRPECIGVRGAKRLCAAPSQKYHLRVIRPSILSTDIVPFSPPPAESGRSSLQRPQARPEAESHRGHEEQAEGSGGGQRQGQRS